MSVALDPVSEPVPVFSPALDGSSVRLLLQHRVHTQSIWGAFNPHTERLVGVQTSGEAIYQAVANAVIATTQATVRTTTGLAAIAAITLGRASVGDNQSHIFAAVSSDSFGNVVTGGIAGQILTVDRIIDGPPIMLGLTVSRGLTGVPIGTIAAFGTGLGGTGTYFLDSAANVPDINTFVLDNDGTSGGITVDSTFITSDNTVITVDATWSGSGGYLVSPDGTRWLRCL